MLNDERPRQNTPALNRTVEVSEATALTPDTEIVLVTLGEAAFDITLPSVTEARGLRNIAVRVVAASQGALAATVKDKGDSGIAVSDALAASGDYAMYVANGDSWYCVAQKLTAG